MNKTVLPKMKFIALFLLCGLLCGCGGTKKTAVNHAHDTAGLEKIFSTLESERVTALRHQDWCQVLGYKRGMFCHSTEGNRPHPATRDAIGFDATAKSDLERIWKKVQDAKVGVLLISDIEFDASGHVKRGEFDCSSGFVRQRYVFDPGYTLPADMPNQMWHTRIDSDWYYVLEDWN